MPRGEVSRMEGCEERSGERLTINISVMRRAEKQLKAIPIDQRARIMKAIDSFEHEFFPRGFEIKKLKTYKSSFRMRVGIWRIIFRVDFDSKEITIGAILQRKHAYK